MDLVAPIIPDAQRNKAPELISEGLIHGFAAMAAMAERRRSAELEAQRLAQQEEIARDQHSFEREKLDQQGELQRALIDARNTVSDAHAYYFRTMADSRSKAVSDGLVGRAEYNQQLSDLQGEATERANELNLNDPKFQTENPVEFAANLQKFKSEYGQAPQNTGIPQRVKDWQTTADQQKIPLKLGAEFDPDKGWKGGVEKTVPIWQVVRDFQNPDTHAQTLNALKASGHITDETYQTPGDPKTLSPWQKMLNATGATNYAPKAGTSTYEKQDDFISNWLNKGKNADWTPGASKVPTFVPHGSTNQIIKSGQQIYPDSAPSPGEQQDTGMIDAVERNDAETGLPVSGSEPPPLSSSGVIGTPTQTDIYLQHAQSAIAAGAPRDAVLERLQSLNIDPSLLAA